MMNATLASHAGIDYTLPAFSNNAHEWISRENNTLMLTMNKTNLRNSMIGALVAIILIAGFVAGSVFNSQPNAKTAESALYDGDNNQIIEIGSGVTTDNPVLVFQSPDITAQQVDRLLWGDRVMWRGVEQKDASDNRWINVYLSEGVSGWMIANLTDQSSGRIKLGSALYTTPGINVGSIISVTADGAAANMRQYPTVAAEIVRKVQAGEQLTVIAGPYASEYFIWWQYTDASGNQGWIVDVQNWFAIAQ